MKGPVEMAVEVEAVDGEVVESSESETVKACVESRLTFFEALAWQKLAGDHPSMTCWLDPFPVQLCQGFAEKGFCWSIGRGRFKMIHAGGMGGSEHREHLIGCLQSAHGA